MTTIIETSRYSAHANTYLLSQQNSSGFVTLYQLRGRVGRSNRIAYAYLMHRPEKSIRSL